ncbi:hypothetical protein B0181_04150 [Moraxella caviae]|uniref:tRNA_anti-like n=1 Tax=Moraxella caviae TaxID=34060 RepID=A0A1T0A5B6_9GAMM|nr:hypothetical protein [Moraxella caviae]OOR90925.1 hypothetical protein B0181_04150 [Moraxella caviae]STZ10186.1 tRNA_anti-like [Moraxella caviae]
MKTLLKIVLGLVVLFVLFAIFAGDDTATSDTSAATDTAQVEIETEVPMEVSARTLYQDYDANEVAGDQKYKGKLLQVSGKVASIDSGLGDEANIRLIGKSEFETVMASGDDEFTQKAATLSKGQDVVMICRGDGEIIGSPTLKQCVIQ